MTVLVRPAPPRAWGNGIRPFQPIRPGPQLPTYTLKTWRPPVPEPLPPAPLLGLPSLLALGFLALLGQFWGLFAGRPAGPLPSGGQLYINDSNQTIYVTPKSVEVYLDGSPDFVVVGRPFAVPPGATYSIPEDIYTTFTKVTSGVSDDPLPTVYLEFVITRTDGGIEWQFLWNSRYFYGYRPIRAGNFRSYYDYGSRALHVEVTTNIGDGTPTPAPDRGRPGLPFIVPSTPLTPFPWITPEELAILRPRPLPLPGGEDLPDPNNPQPQPAPEVPPFPLPVPAPPLVPPLPPGQILPPGFPPPVPVPPAPVPTPPDWHFPVPGLPIPPAPPPPTLDGIALEVGRIENKVARLLTPGGGTPLDQLGTLVSLVSTLLEILQSITGGGSYTLEAPCETAEDGSPLVVEHPYSGALNSFGVLSNKLDAIAAVLQTHKNQKQPICKAPPRQGQAVTVNFEEV